MNQSTQSTNNIIPVITMYQPWASWVMLGWKNIETRIHKRFLKLVGKTFGIHAGLTFETSPAVFQNPYLKSEQIKDRTNYETGVFLGTVYGESFSKLDASHSERALIDCSEENRYGIFVSNPMIYPSVKVTGERGIWYFDLDTMQKVKKPI